MIEEHSEKVVSLDQKQNLSEGFIVKIFKYRNFITVAILGIFVIGFVIAKWMPKSAPKENDFFQSGLTFAKWKNSSGLEKGLIQTLNEASVKHPELAGLYSGDINQRFIALGLGKERMKNVESMLNQMESMDCYYVDFSNTTLLVIDEKYEQALSDALELKHKMSEDQGFMRPKEEGYGSGRVLFAFNLIRIASLQKHLGMPMEELATLEELENFIKESENSEFFAYASDIQKLKSHLSNENVSLLDYLHYRKSALQTLL